MVSRYRHDPDSLVFLSHLSDVLEVNFAAYQTLVMIFREN